MICPLVCTTSHDLVPISNPEGYVEPPRSVICPCCSETMRPEYRKDKQTCNICFVLCVPCGSSDPKLVCTRCNRALVTNQPYICKSCNVGTTAACDYCPSCGSKK